MKGALYFSGQYGSTAQYAQWIHEATTIPVYDINQAHPDPADFDFLVLGSSVIVGKLTIRHWIKKYLHALSEKPVLLFSVAGAPPGPEVDKWVAKSLPTSLTEKIKHVALRGKLDISMVSWWTRVVLKIGAWAAKNEQDKREMTEGFDFMDKNSIEPIIKSIEGLQSAN
ncbi:flavodoxin domain-containing protein [Aurantivibrio infirmus]